MKIIILLIVVLILCTYAIYQEYINQPNSYLEAIPKKTDDIKTLLTKIMHCLNVEKKTVKWRRSLIGSCIFTGMFCIFTGKLPNFRELFGMLLISYIVYYFMWEQYAHTISHKVSDIGRTVLKQLKTRMYDRK